MQNSGATFQHLVKIAGLGINLGKSNIAELHVLYLGHEVGKGTVNPTIAKVASIALFPPLTDRKSLKRFLGNA